MAFVHIIVILDKNKLEPTIKNILISVAVSRIGLSGSGSGLDSSRVNRVLGYSGIVV